MNKEFMLINTSNPYLQMDFNLTNWASGTYVVASPIEDTGDLFQNSAIRKNENNEDE